MVKKQKPPIKHYNYAALLGRLDWYGAHIDELSVQNVDPSDPRWPTWNDILQEGVLE